MLVACTPATKSDGDCTERGSVRRLHKNVRDVEFFARQWDFGSDKEGEYQKTFMIDGDYFSKGKTLFSTPTELMASLV